ncbi:laccase [Suillus bovinus]|uniref:laccase n=1 Tax=Suillus bovinus TaxID=48563 RepID=UPI001B864484|nr:laccase [Suillus bovinus]KAG2143749.1 laccase [Suillus bovinus]
MFPRTVLAGCLLALSHAVSVASSRSNYDNSPSSASPFTLKPVAELVIVNKVIAPDGFARSATLAGGIFPAPLIKAQKNDNFSINVVNRLHDKDMPTSTSVHWHGIQQKKTNWADGASFITQCPIPQNRSFLHQFSAPNQTGTFWYHSHFSTQYCDGLRGPLIIYDPDDPHQDLYDVDDESTIITLSDWYHDPTPKLNKIFAPIVANSTLINGLGRYHGGPKSPLSVINVEQGKRYRFRILGLSCDPSYNFTIDGHTMTIIEADGIETVPETVDYLPVLAGQRYSVVVHANQPVDNYWVRAPSNAPNQTFAGGLSQAILRYNGAPDEDPTSTPGPYILPFNEGKLASLHSIPVPGFPEIGKADVHINLLASTVKGVFRVNNVSYHNPPTPVLLQMLSGAQHPSDLLPSGSVYELPSNKVVEIAFPNTGLAFGGPHPIHLHGHTFAVVRTSGNSTTNFVNPIWRDTVTMGSTGDNVTIRFVTDNSGPWFIHCHIDFHLNHGFAVVMAEARNQLANINASIPASWASLCPSNKPSSQARLGAFNTTTSRLGYFNATTLT